MTDKDAPVYDAAQEAEARPQTGNGEAEEIKVGSEGGAVPEDINDANALKELLDAEKANAAENYDRLLRMTAEFENYKKRVLRDMDDLRKFANETLIKELLSVVDNLERAIMASEPERASEGACLIEGVEMTLNEILRVLKKFHVTSVEAMGKPFDPLFHEAVMQEETDEYPENTVINEMQKGYMLHDRLIRPAMVVVSKKGPGSRRSGEQDA
ncbi:MAG: nucleotide exchange factor GrpE [Deltaproteobacteria bacterium]|nr:nucleotide exchange factor GrpE [Deltaproteobacteria bacterium]